MSEANTRETRLLFAAAFVLGVVARFMLPRFGFNFDAVSYRIVADIVTSGGNVYAETPRYNYGPAWFLILGALRWAAAFTGEPTGLFRSGIVAVLTLADLAIAAILNRRFGARAAVLFFLNPVSILITGYHNQFDTLAIAVGFAAVLTAEKADADGDGKRRLAALALLGLSLTVKHIFFLLPLWLAFRAGTWRDRTLAVSVPVAIFLASFLPFAPHGWHGIVHNVFLYRSFPNGLTTRLLAWLGMPIPPSLLLIAGLALAGWLLRRRPLFEAVLVYLVLLVILSPGMANQYLAIPMAAVLVALNPAYALYAVAATLIILSNRDGLWLNLFTRAGLGWIDGERGYDVPVALLAAGLSWQLLGWRRTGRRARPQRAGLPG